MNCDFVKKNICLKTFLIQHFGFEIEYSRDYEHWGKSVFRREKTSSMKVNDKYNSFIDFGAPVKGKLKPHGTIIDFICYYYDIDEKESLGKIASFSFPQQNKVYRAEEKKETPQYLIEGVYDIKSQPLIDYLISRRLPLKICKKYLVELHYSLNGKKYYRVGFKNNVGGYEVNWRYYDIVLKELKTKKICLGQKGITSIFKGNKSVIIFESWSDLLAYITKFPECEVKNDFIVLNSVSLNGRLPTLDNYVTIKSALDNDVAGNELTHLFEIEYGKRHESLNHIYQPYKDLNEWLIQKQ